MTDVTRYNFKALRKKNKIKVEAISNMCKLSANTIRHFENSCTKGYTDGVLARDYNADLIIRTLQKLIDEKEVTKMNENNKSKQPEAKVKVKSADLAKTISAYASANDMTVKEFAIMCNVSCNIFAPYYIKQREYVSQPTIKKICDATGWTVDQIMFGDILNSIKNEEGNMSYIGTKKSAEVLNEVENQSKMPVIEEPIQKEETSTVSRSVSSKVEKLVSRIETGSTKSVVIEFEDFDRFEKALINLQKDRLDSMHGYMAYSVRKENIGYYNAMTDVLELVSELKTKAKLQ